MPRYIIEREIFAAGNLSPDHLQSIAQKPSEVATAINPITAEA